MTETNLSNEEIQARVRLELHWAPDLDDSRIDVAVTNGTVTLSGEVDDFSMIDDAERAALRATGVIAVARDITVYNESAALNDTDIARAVAFEIGRSSAIPAGSVHAAVTHGSVHLTGRVPWGAQRTSAEDAVKDLRGVRTVVNGIVVYPAEAAAETREYITSVLETEASEEGHRLVVTADADGHVVLEGSVRSTAAFEEISSAAGSAPGVTKVSNRLEVALDHTEPASRTTLRTEF